MTISDRYFILKKIAGFMTWTEFGALGIGSIIGGVTGAYFQSRFQYRKQLREWEHEVKKLRYSSLNLLLIAKLDPNKHLPASIINRADIDTEQKLDAEIEIEYFNAMLFSKFRTLTAIRDFMDAPSRQTYFSATSAMRKELWHGKPLENLLPLL